MAAPVACPSLFADWIEQLKAEFVTSGCGNGTVYCPLQNNTRGQMATFLVRAYEFVGPALTTAEPPISKKMTIMKLTLSLRCMFFSLVGWARYQH